MLLFFSLEMSDDEEVPAYQIRDPDQGSAGKALIINVLNKYSEKYYREGSSNDVTKMKEVFEHLNFEVSVAQSEDPTAQEIKDEIKKFRENLKVEREGDFDMVAVCLMGHGKEGIIYGSDVGEVDLREEVFNAFSNKNCPVLSGKPRLFFTQACRGDKKDEGIDGSSTLKRYLNTQTTTFLRFEIIYLFIGVGELITRFPLIKDKKEKLH